MIRARLHRLSCCAATDQAGFPQVVTVSTEQVCPFPPQRPQRLDPRVRTGADTVLLEAEQSSKRFGCTLTEAILARVVHELRSIDSALSNH